MSPYTYGQWFAKQAVQAAPPPSRVQPPFQPGSERARMLAMAGMGQQAQQPAPAPAAPLIR